MRLDQPGDKPLSRGNTLTLKQKRTNVIQKLQNKFNCRVVSRINVRNEDETFILTYIYFVPAFYLIKTNISFVNDFDL